MKISKKLFDKYIKNNPFFLIDGGALDGLKRPWDDLAGYLSLIGFEPQMSDKNSDACLRTVSSGDNILFDPIALSDKVCESVPFYITNHNDNSSLLKPNTNVLKKFAMGKKFEIISQVFLNTDTIDNQLTKKKISFVDFIKIDTQGSELSILNGSENIINKSVFGVEVEINFIERYSGQNYFSDIDIFLRNLGFELYDLERRFAKRTSGVFFGGDKGQITHGTALYIRNFEYSKKIISSFSNEDRKSYFFHYLIIFLIYGYFDVATECLNYYKELFSSDELLEIKEFISLNSNRRVRLLGNHGSNKIYRLFHFISKLFRPSSVIGVTGDSSLGNINY